MASKKESLIEHMDRDAQAFGLPTYTELLMILKRSASVLAETPDARLPTVLVLRERTVAAIKAVHPEYYGISE